MRRASRVTLVLLAWSAGLPAPGQEEGPTIAVDFVVRDRRQAPVTDLKAADVELRQDDITQAVLSLEPAGTAGAYVVRYRPRSGQPGALWLRVLRPGAVASGPDGGALKITVVAPLTPLERRMLAVLDGPAPSAGIPHEAFRLRFERTDEGLHHTFGVEVPLGRLELVERDGLVRGHVGLVARVKDVRGRTVHRFSLAYPIEAAAEKRNALHAERVVWTTHLHLKPGAYVLETAAADLTSDTGSTVRQAFEVPAPPAGLHTSSLVLLAPEGALAAEGNSADNPLLYGDRQLVPARRRVFLAGAAEPLPFYLIIYPDASLPEPVQASVELYREGTLRAQGSISLPAGKGGAIPYVGSFPVARLVPGTYEMRVVTRQGRSLVEQAAEFEVLPLPDTGASHRGDTGHTRRRKTVDSISAGA